MNILAISGSTRQASTNTALLRALCVGAPPGMHIEVFDRIGQFPVFSPDLEGARTPEIIRDFIAKVDQADGVIIASPEYVRAIPGGMKNAIDWLVSGEAIIHKPVALAHASHRGDDMLASLRIVLGTVSSRFAEQVFVRFPLMAQTPDEIFAVLEQAENRSVMAAYLTAFAGYVGEGPAADQSA